MKNKLEVWKFGGASLADAAAIQRASKLIAAHDGPLVVVASALAGITDLLISGAGAPTGAAKLASVFLQRHRQAVKALLPPGKRRRALLGRIDEAAREYRDLSAAVAVLGHLEPRTLDLLVSRGERMSAALLAEAISQASRRRAVYVDATELVATDGQHGGAAPDLPRTRRACAPRAATADCAPNHPGRPGIHRTGGGRKRRNPWTRRIRPDGHAARPFARSQAGGPLEGRAGHPDRRPTPRAGRATAAAASPSRGCRSRALRSQSAPSARTYSDRRHAHHPARPVVPRSFVARNRGLRAARARGVSGQGAGDRPRPGHRDGCGQGHGGRSRHRGADICGR